MTPQAQAVPPPAAFVPGSGSPFATGGTTYDAAFNPAGSLVAAASYSSISMFSVNPLTGTLNMAPGSPVDDFSHAAGKTEAEGGYGIPNSVAFDPANPSLLAVGDDFGYTVEMYSVAANGTIAPVSGSPFSDPDGSRDVAFSANGKFLATASDRIGGGLDIYQVNTSTGALTPVPGSPFALPGGSPVPYKVAFGGSGLLAVLDIENGLDIYSVDPTTGVPTLTSRTPVTNPYSLAFSPNGKVVAVSSDTYSPSASYVDLFTVSANGSTVTSAPGSPVTLGGSAFGLGFNGTGQLLGAAEANQAQIEIFSVAATGAATAVPGSPITTAASYNALGGGVSSVDFSPTGSLASGDQDGSVVVFAPVPTATINSPASNLSFRLGLAAPTSFSCADPYGGGIRTCRDSNGATAGAGALNTNTAGTYIYSVSATNDAGQTAASSINYTVPQAATKLTATPVLIGGVSALLTRSDTSAPLPGEMLTFKAGTATLCTALTGTNGRATCPASARLKATLAGGYTVTFAGDNNYVASAAHAGLL